MARNQSEQAIISWKRSARRKSGEKYWRWGCRSDEFPV